MLRTASSASSHTAIIL